MIKKKLTNLLLVLVLLIGVSLLLYPTVSEKWNEMHSARAIDTYVHDVAKINHKDYSVFLNQAHEYNENLADNDHRFSMTEDEEKTYNSVLNPFGNGIIGYVDIPSIHVSLPIYHGTDESVLQIAVGHIEGSSMPVGGESTHAVLSGHRGLPSAKLFTDIVKLKEGDIFSISVLNETYTYEVDRILTVEPADMSGLAIEEGKDFCTLVTCTPYGINTHRLLVRGHRIENAEKSHVVSEGKLFDPLLVASTIAVPILIILLIIVIVRTRNTHKEG